VGLYIEKKTIKKQRDPDLKLCFWLVKFWRSPNGSLGGGGDLVLGSVNIFSHFSHLSKMGPWHSMETCNNDYPNRLFAKQKCFAMLRCSFPSELLEWFGLEKIGNIERGCLLRNQRCVEIRDAHTKQVQVRSHLFAPWGSLKCAKEGCWCYSEKFTIFQAIFAPISANSS